MLSRYILLTVLFMSCAAPVQRTLAASDLAIINAEEEAKIEKTAIFSENFEQTWQSVVMTLVAAGYTIAEESKESGKIVTDYMRTTGSTATRIQHRHNLTVSVTRSSPQSTSVTITADFQKKEKVKQRWQWAHRRQYQLDMEKNIFRQIADNVTGPSTPAYQSVPQATVPESRGYQKFIESGGDETPSQPVPAPAKKRKGGY